MRYNIHGLAKKPNEYVFLIGWKDVSINRTLFEFGDRAEWYRNRHRGFIFPYENTTVCVYASPHGFHNIIDYSIAQEVAEAYITGNCVRIDIDLADRS